ncbi:MAG: ferritin family protein [Planctomycetota bacterium]|jgi:rubrerythrin
MKTFGSVDEILDFAIGREAEAIQLYKDLAARVDKPEIQKVLEDFAEEELEHKAKLEAVRKGEVALTEEAVGDLGIADYVGGGEPRPDMSYADVLVLAMKKEKVSYKLYWDLAAMVKDQGLKDIFMLLAQEEAHHKLRFEVEYDLTTF